MSDLRQKLVELAMSEAAQYGEAKSKSVIGKAMGKYPELRSSAKELMQIIDEVIDEVNSLSPEELKPYLPSRKPKVEKAVERELPPLNNTEKVVLRFAPGPSGPLHLGHTRALALNNYYKKRYGGKLILRLEDTNPNAIDHDAYDMIQSDLDWLNVEVDEVVIQSDRMVLYYEEIRKILTDGGAYVTNSDAEEWRELKRQKKAHPDRERPSEVQLSDFENLLSGGEGIVVIKTDLKDPNPALRDFVALRVVEESHPRQNTKYRLWPLYNYAVAVDDYHLGITHVLRGKDHLNNTLKQKWIYKYLGWDEPEYIHYGLVSIPNTNLKTSKIRESIKAGEFSGWDDCRLATLKGLARRGYKSETFLKYWENSGLKEVDIKFSWQNFDAMNKDFIDSESRRLFFVADPVEFTMETADNLVKDAPWHPDKPEWGKREEVISSGSKIYLQKEDVNSFKEGQDIRLKNLCNVTVKGNKLIFAGMKPQKGNQILQWCSSNVSIDLVYPDGDVVKGIVEDNISELDGETVQFERVGFVRLEGKKAFFLHR
ncbi:MAG TPA: glutamate--tRNA ligase [Candidatus Poseidoniia archaeon]|nr:glutamate--tRNA ligase [Candidatus Poseidoniia archaeon]